jgi:L-lactate dehydrogenase complex protein LldG
MMKTRDDILSRLKRTPLEMPSIEKRNREYPDLAAQFTKRLEDSNGEVYRVDDLNLGFLKLRNLFEEFQVKFVATHRVPPLDAIDLPEEFPKQTWYISGEVEDYRSLCARADVGLTTADFALAETGSLVISAGSSRSRLTSLLPPIHIVLLPESRILPSLFDWIALRPENLPSNLILISGPSKTADIEQTLVVGVHGPKQLIVIVYPD